MRVICYTGKGGVGKTTVAAATALALSRRGRRVLVMSTDAAHSLADSLQTPLGNEPEPVAPELWALEVDAMAENDKAWKAMRAYWTRLLSRSGEQQLAAEEMLVLPGSSELFALLRLLDLVESGDYDTIVVDCAPTGQTLAMLHYPEQLGDFITKVLPAKRAMARVAGKPIERLTSLPMPDVELFDQVAELIGRLRALGELLHDERTSSLRIVTTPERIVVQESRRNFTWLSMYGYNVDAVVLNRVYPAAALEGYFRTWREQHSAGIQVIEESFTTMPIFRLELQPHEVVGLDALGEIAGPLYGDTDPGQVLGRRAPLRVRDTATGEKELHISLPEADKRELELVQDGTELVVSYRNQRRRFDLPDALVDRQVARARYEDRTLILTMVR